MSGKITMRCPKCGRCESVERATFDYPEAVRLEFPCPRCDDGERFEIHYYDAAGQHITRDPTAPMAEPRFELPSTKEFK